jgi:glycosyltransferase involved in cell wall biosynthesis
MRVVVVTKIFPSSLEPLSAPFNRLQMTELARSCDLDLLVAIPHVPLAAATGFPARAARLTELPTCERVHGLPVTYVRQLYVPRIGLAAAVPLYLASLLPYRERLRAADVVLGAWAYPDGCAAVLAARMLGKPCVVKVHGSDVNILLKRRFARTVAARVLPKADAVVAVSQPLAVELERIGVAPERVHLVPNGVDTSLFFPRDRARARRACVVAEDARVVLFVGRLEPQKGVRELLIAFDRVRREVPRAMLVFIGDGVSLDEVRSRAARWGEDAVRVLGPRPQSEVAQWMGACDVVVLPSWAEGTPNVVLEALASRRPVVATSVGGIPAVLSDPQCGLLVPPKNEQALAEGLLSALRRRWDGYATSRLLSWNDSALAIHAVLTQAIEADRARGLLAGAGNHA